MCNGLNEIVRFSHDEIQISLDEIKSVFSPPQAISFAKQISSTIVDLFRHKTDLVEKTADFDTKSAVFSGGKDGMQPLRVLTACHPNAVHFGTDCAPFC